MHIESELGLLPLGLHQYCGSLHSHHREVRLMPRTHDPNIVRKMSSEEESSDNRIVGTGLDEPIILVHPILFYRTCTSIFLVRYQIVRFSFGQYSCRLKIQYKYITTHDITSFFIWRTRIFVTLATYSISTCD